MAVRSPKNEYRGVNAHLHSVFQAKGGWSGFHSMHITTLASSIDRLLPDGYLIDLEESLQIKEYHPDANYKLPEDEPPLDHYHLACVIYQITEDALLGRPITRIEMLVPTNKYGFGLLRYSEIRMIELKTGFKLVEIDYLHETAPIFKYLPSYLLREEKSFPYHIAITDPIPTLEEGIIDIYSFEVDQSIPQIQILLVGDDSITVDLNAIYNKTFESLTAYSHRVDYGLLPERFETYSPEDQERIRQVMNRIIQ